MTSNRPVALGSVQQVRSLSKWQLVQNPTCILALLGFGDGGVRGRDFIRISFDASCLMLTRYLHLPIHKPQMHVDFTLKGDPQLEQQCSWANACLHAFAIKRRFCLRRCQRAA